MSSTEGLRSFYEKKNIFITGGSGFVGICLLEKVFRCIPEHGTIYLLLRPKRGKQISERIDDLKKNAIFANLLKNRSAENVFAKVQAVAGDVGKENLGLSPDDRKLLTDNVNIIFHSAATLDFGETLKTTVEINLLGTRRIAQLARECKNLAVLVHVSSAYVNSWKLDANEIIYPLSHNPDELIATVQKLSPEELEKQTPEILGDHPNSYTITKHMAEHEVQKLEDIIPSAIVRPSMIVSAWHEPVPGWTISKNGPQGFLLGAAKGVIRRVPLSKNLIYDYIPVDIVVNNILAAGYYTGVTKPSQVSVYHCTSSTRNPCRWSCVADYINNFLCEYPLSSAVWYPYLRIVSSVTWYKISAIFVHFFPALILDTITKLSGGRPILMKLHRNVNTSLDRLLPFIFREYIFPAVRTMELHEWLDQNDKIDFNLDISGIEWKTLFGSFTHGARMFLSNDPDETLPAARIRHRILLAIHIIWHVLLFTVLWYMFACLTGYTMSECYIILPVLYVLYSLL